MQETIARRTKAQIFTALYDSSCETKLKMQGFMHYVAPKAANMIAVYF